MIQQSETLTGSNTSATYSCERSGTLSFQFAAGSWNSGTITVQGSLNGTNWDDLTGGTYSDDAQDVVDKWYGYIRFVATGITSVTVLVNTAG